MNHSEIKKIFAESKIGWGFSLIFFGMLFFFKQTNLLPADSWPFNPKNYPIYLCVIFLITNNIKLGIGFLLLSALIYIGVIVRTMRGIKEFIVPILFILAGAGIILFAKNDKGK